MSEQAENIVKKWLEKTIIGLNLCPFAKIPFEEGLIHITSSSLNKLDQSIAAELAFFTERKFSNSLVIIEDAPQSFTDFYEITEKLNELYDDVQFVAFHPQFQFQGLKKNDRANYVNRSPFPIIHILQARDIENALKNPEQAEKISHINEKTLCSLSESEIKNHFPSYSS